MNNKIFHWQLQVWFQNRRMKDKRQRSSLMWPYSMFNNPATAFLTAAPAYPGAGHLAPGYGVSSPPYFASRYSPYGSPPSSRSPYGHQAASAYQQMLFHPNPEMSALHYSGMPAQPAMVPNYVVPEPGPLQTPSSSYFSGSVSGFGSSPSYIPETTSGAGSPSSYDSAAASRVSPDPNCIPSLSGEATSVQSDNRYLERGSPLSLDYSVSPSSGTSYDAIPVSGFASEQPLMPSYIPPPTPPSSPTSSPSVPKDESSRSDPSTSYDGESSFESCPSASPPRYNPSSVNGLSTMPSCIPTPPSSTDLHRADSDPVHSSLGFEEKCDFESCDRDSDFEPRTSSTPIDPSPVSRLPPAPTHISIPTPPSRTSSVSSAHKAHPSPALLRLYRGCEGEAVSYEFGNKDANVDGLRNNILSIGLPNKTSTANLKESTRAESKKLFQPYRIGDRTVFAKSKTIN